MRRLEPEKLAPHRAAAVRCHVSPCSADATHTPVLCVALAERKHVSRIALPARVCRDHREAFVERFLTPTQRARIEASLRAHGRDTPDWSRTHLEFIPMHRRP